MGQDLELDINRVVTNYLESQLESIFRTLGIHAQRATSSMRSHFKRTYSAYLQELLRRTNETKTFLNRDRPVSFEQIYVPLDLAGRDERYPGANVQQLTLISQPSFIIGGAGMGKSLLMRHLILDAIKSSSYTPILIELRRLNESDQSLRDILRQITQDLGLKLDEKVFSSLLGSGRFLLLLDGFDEVRHERRPEITKQILSLVSSVYSRTPIIISSRPEPSLEGWPYFRTLNISPLSLDKAIDLVRRSPVDREVKEAFLRDLRSHLYQSRKSFAENPLLLSIMLLTFSQNAYVPLKRSLFFEKAYDVLFDQHDALKPAFKRERRSGLDIVEFGKLFSAFALISYDDAAIRFSRRYAHEVAAEAALITEVPASSEDFIYDATQAVSLLVQDGLDLAYAHRSFQEYFTARYIIDQANSELRAELLDKYSARMSDEVLGLAFEINPHLVEQDFLSRKSNELLKLFHSIELVDEAALRRWFQFLGLKFSVHSSSLDSTGDGISTEVRWQVEKPESFAFCERLLQLYRPQDWLIDREGWKDVILEAWRESGRRSAKWSFQGNSEEELLRKLAMENGIFSLARLEQIASVIQAMERSLKREGSVRELLKRRRQSQLGKDTSSSRRGGTRYYA